MSREPLELQVLSDPPVLSCRRREIAERRESPDHLESQEREDQEDTLDHQELLDQLDHQDQPARVGQKETLENQEIGETPDQEDTQESQDQQVLQVKMDLMVHQALQERLAPWDYLAPQALLAEQEHQACPAIREILEWLDHLVELENREIVERLDLQDLLVLPVPPDSLELTVPLVTEEATDNLEHKDQWVQRDLRESEVDQDSLECRERLDHLEMLDHRE